MRNLKKFLALVLAMMMVFSLMVTANAAVSTSEQQDAYDALEDYGVFQGVGTLGNDEITKNYTRAQMATIAYRIMTGDTSTDGEGAKPYANYAAQRFSDVKATDWYAGYVGWCANAEVVIGFPDETFKGDIPVTGFQTALMLLRALGYDAYDEIGTGSDWQVKVGSYSRQYGILGNVDIGQLTDPATRGLAAYMTYRAVSIPNMVRPAGNGVYTSRGMTLISKENVTTTYDDWGAPATAYTVSFNWGNIPVRVAKEVPDDPLGQWWTAVTECDVAEQVKISSSKTYSIIYTNGVRGGSQQIQATDTVGTIGAQGRWTRVYSDRIVYVDYYLATVDSTTSAIKDEAGHTIRPASAAITIYSNNNTNLIYGSTTPVAASSSISSDAYSVGDVLMVNVKGGSVTTSAAVAATRVANPVKLNATPVTVKAISYTDNAKTSPNGFEANGVTYLYDNTYGNCVIPRLTDNAINRDYLVFTNPNGDGNSVLGLIPISSTSYGVILGYEARKIATNKYVLDIEVFTEDETTITISTLNGSNGYFDSVSAAEGYGESLVTVSTGKKDDYLIRYTVNPADTDYHTITKANWRQAQASIDEGYAGVIGSTNHFNDDTVFFIAQYDLKNSKTGYVSAGYKVVRGFKNIGDLSASSDNIDGAAQPNSNRLQFYYFASDGWADYVLVLYATEEAENTKETVPDYAFVLTGQSFVKVYDDYSAYTSIFNGTPNRTLDVYYTATGNITQNGLYTYRDLQKNNGSYKTVNLAEADIGGTDYVMAIDGGSYDYWAGVLWTTAAVKSDGSGPVPSGKNGLPINTYLTVADDVAVYIVNPTTGGSFYAGGIDDLAGLTAGNVYGGNDIWFQYDEYGWIDYIYIVAEADAGTTPTTQPAIAVDPQFKTQYYNMGITWEVDDDTITFTWSANELNKKLVDPNYAGVWGVMENSSQGDYLYVGVNWATLNGTWDCEITGDQEGTGTVANDDNAYFSITSEKTEDSNDGSITGYSSLIPGTYTMKVVLTSQTTPTVTYTYYVVLDVKA